MFYVNKVWAAGQVCLAVCGLPYDWISCGNGRCWNQNQTLKSWQTLEHKSHKTLFWTILTLWPNLTYLSFLVNFIAGINVWLISMSHTLFSTKSYWMFLIIFTTLNKWGKLYPTTLSANPLHPFVLSEFTCFTHQLSFWESAITLFWFENTFDTGPSNQQVFTWVELWLAWWHHKTVNKLHQ